MKQILCFCCFVFIAFNASAATRYVDLNSTTPTLPYINWSTAATNIQDAVDAASSGDLVLVNDGVYRTGGRVAVATLTNRVVVNKPLTLQSVNGPGATLIEGYQVSSEPYGRGTNAMRCLYLTNGASLIGFTLSNGATMYEYPADIKDVSGAGLYCDGNCVVSNCILIRNNSGHRGGGAYQGTFLSCVVKSNNGSVGGGTLGATMINCTISYNQGRLEGGGVAYGNLTNCTLTGNHVTDYGGGASDSTLTSCVLSGNQSNAGGGAWQCVLNNCILFSNDIPYTVGAGGGAQWSTLNNCTVFGNSATNGGIGGGSFGCTLNNCIVFGNYASTNPDYNGSSTLNYCCAAPLPPSGIGNITNEPLFIDQIAGNFRLQTNSPCINSGGNLYVTNSADLDGNPRIAGGTVDIGAYEFQSPSSALSYAWAQQYGISTDGSADLADTDGDGASNCQEWIAGTVPTDSSSVLKMLSVSNNGSGLAISWQSVNGKNYFLQRSSNLSAQPAFYSIQSNIAGLAGTTTFTDTTATNGGPYFYRVGVQ